MSQAYFSTSMNGLPVLHPFDGGRLPLVVENYLAAHRIADTGKKVQQAWETRSRSSRKIIASKTFFHLDHDLVNCEAGWLHARWKFLEYLNELDHPELYAVR